MAEKSGKSALPALDADIQSHIGRRLPDILRRSGQPACSGSLSRPARSARARRAAPDGDRTKTRAQDLARRRPSNCRNDPTGSRDGRIAFAEFKAALLAEIPTLRAFALSLTGSATAPTISCRTLWSRRGALRPRSPRAPPCAPGCSPSPATLSIRTTARPAARSRTSTGPRRRGSSPIPPRSAISTLPISAPRWPRFPTISARRSFWWAHPDFPYEEAAEICGCAVGTIKSRVNRARQKLMEILSLSSSEDFNGDFFASNQGEIRSASR